MNKIAKAPISGAALAAALDLYTQRKNIGKDTPLKDYNKARGVVAALSGALGGAAASKLIKSLSAKGGASAAEAALGVAKKDMSFLGRKALLK